MPRSLPLVFVLALGCVEPLAPAELTIATWNVHRLFDTRCDSGACGEGAFEAVPTEAELEGQLDRVAAGIAGLEADVVLLQEIETEALLDALAVRLAAHLPYGVFGEKGTAGSVDVAVLSRFPIAWVERHGDEPLLRPDGSPTTFAREVLEVGIAVGERRVVVLAAHLKAKRDDDPGRRWAEARRLGELGLAAAATEPEALVVLGGDLNDVPGSPPLVALEQGGSLHRAAEHLGPAAATHRYLGVDEAIDHLYLPRGHLAALDAGSVRVVGAPATGHAGSDHAGLVARFRLTGPPGDDPARDPR